MIMPDDCLIDTRWLCFTIQLMDHLGMQRSVRGMEKNGTEVGYQTFLSVSGGSMMGLFAIMMVEWIGSILVCSLFNFNSTVSPKTTASTTHICGFDFMIPHTIEEMNFQGTVPTEIGALTALTHLSLSKCFVIPILKVIEKDV